VRGHELSLHSAQRGRVPASPILGTGRLSPDWANLSISYWIGKQFLQKPDMTLTITPDYLMGTARESYSHRFMKKMFLKHLKQNTAL
jgi:hypothetical protein